MGIETLAILSLLPIAAVALFLVILRWPASRAMPILVGVKTGLDVDFGETLSTNETVLRVATQAGYTGGTEFLAMIGLKVATLHAVTGTLIPLFVVAVMTRFFGKNRSLWEGLAVWRFALFAALAMTIPYVAIAYLLGPDFPSLIGGLVGLAIVVPAAKAGWFMPPKDETWDFEEPDKWDPEWTGTPVEVNPNHGRDLGSVIVAGIVSTAICIIVIGARKGRHTSLKHTGD